MLEMEASDERFAEWMRANLARAARHFGATVAEEPASIGGATGTALGRRGRYARLRASWPTRATQDGRCGTATAPTMTLLTSATRSQGLAGEWAISQDVAHPPLISERDFVAAQNIRAARPTADGSTRTYLPTGLVQCGLCARRMEAH